MVKCASGKARLALVTRLLATVMRLLATPSLPTSASPFRAYLARNRPGPTDSLPLSPSLLPFPSLRSSPLSLALFASRYSGSEKMSKCQYFKKKDGNGRISTACKFQVNGIKSTDPVAHIIMTQIKSPRRLGPVQLDSAANPA
jgi:hypothetical protein